VWGIVHRSERETIARGVLARSSADETEVLVSSSDSGLTRFTHGVSNQNVAAADRTVSVRAISGKRVGVAATNELSEASLDALVRRALEMAELAPSDPMRPPLAPGGASSAPEGAFVEATAHADPLVRARICEAIFERTEASSGAWCAGYASTSRAGITIANSSGALASFDGTDAQANVKITATDSTGFAERYSADVGEIDGDAVGRIAAEKTRAGANPRSVEPGEWTVILEPPAFGELLVYLMSHFSAQSYDEGSSFFAGALGERFFPESVTIADDYAHRLAPGMPFDFEGQPKSRVTLVDRGIVREIVTDGYYAHKLGRPNTGHALPAPNAAGPQALNVVVAGGPQTTEQLVSETTRGLLVSRFWYIRTVDRKRAIVTGMTRDGTFLIERGRIAAGVRNLRFNQSIVDALARATFANDQTRSGGYSYSIVVPTARIEKFHFTSGTEF
jgi:PmbA protein